MAGKLIPLDIAAQQLGVSPDELNDLRQRQEIYGYRDGASWKFKQEDVERLKADRARGSSGNLDDSRELSDLPLGSIHDSEDSGEDVVLLSEFEFGESGPSTSSTVIKSPTAGMPGDSDLKLATGSERPGASDVRLAGDSNLILGGGSSAINLGTPGSGSSKKGPSASKTSLKRGSDINRKKPGEESSVEISTHDSGAPIPVEGAGDSGLTLAEPHSDELVLGGGSDLTHSPGDSGISLADPVDSGLSLEQPLQLHKQDDDFELGGSESDEVLGLSDDDFDSDAVVEVKADDDFLLTPLEEVGDEESEDSGSQVIALGEESGEFDDSSATMLGQGEQMGAMLEEEPFLEASDPLGGGVGGQAMAPGLMPTAPMGTVVVGPPQTTFSPGVIVALSFGVLFLALCGMMTYDLARNMWSWDQPYAVNSSIMDTLLPLFER